MLCPGLIDMQVFTGEPGQEHRETLKTASHAAAAGGVTTIVVMPDTEPVIDQVALVDFIQRRARDNAVVNVHVMAAMTRGLKGQDMTEIGLLEAGRRHRLHQRQVERGQHARHAQRAALCQGLRRADRAPHRGSAPHRGHASMNAGEVATRLGLPGVDKAAETIVLERDVRLVEITGGRYHASHAVTAPRAWP